MKKFTKIADSVLVSLVTKTLEELLFKGNPSEFSCKTVTETIRAANPESFISHGKVKAVTRALVDDLIAQDVGITKSYNGTYWTYRYSPPVKQDYPAFNVSAS